MMDKHCTKCGSVMDYMGYEGSYICPLCRYQIHKIIIERRE